MIPTNSSHAHTTTATLATVADMRERIRRSSRLKGRQVDDAALAEVKALLGAAAYRRDLLIEYLHLLNDRYRGLHDRHLVALASAINLPVAEIYVERGRLDDVFRQITSEERAPRA